MKLAYVAALGIIWGVTLAGAYLLHVPEIFFAGVAGTVLMTICCAIEVTS